MYNYMQKWSEPDIFSSANWLKGIEKGAKCELGKVNGFLYYFYRIVKVVPS